MIESLLRPRAVFDDELTWKADCGFILAHLCRFRSLLHDLERDRGLSSGSSSFVDFGFAQLVVSDESLL